MKTSKPATYGSGFAFAIFSWSLKKLIR